MNGLMFKLRERRLKMIRAGIIAGVAMATVVLAAACTPGSGAPGVAATAPEPSGTVEFWHQFTDRESEAIASIVADFEAKYPKVHVNVTDGQDDDKTLQAMVALELGVDKRSAFNSEEYLRSVPDVKKGIGRYAELFRSHPYVPKRVQALRLFAGSAMYAQALGQDPTGKPSLVEIDKQVGDLISVF